MFPSTVSDGAECGRGRLQALKLLRRMKLFCNKQQHISLFGSFCTTSCWLRCTIITRKTCIGPIIKALALPSRPQKGAGATTTAARRRGRNRDGRTKVWAQPRRPQKLKGAATTAAKGVNATATAARCCGCNHDAKTRLARDHLIRTNARPQPRQPKGNP